jgi:hypothetical protein
MAKISNKKNKTTLFWRKKAKINLHQNFRFTNIYGIFLENENRERSITFGLI